MNKEVENIIRDMDKEQPTTIRKIKEVEKKIGIAFPNEYKEIMLYSNGMEGPIGEEGYLCIWPIEEIIPLNDKYSVSEFTPGIVYFGSDGGDVAYGFDYNNEKILVIEIPFDSIHIEDEKVYSTSFYEFLAKMCDK